MDESSPLRALVLMGNSYSECFHRSLSSTLQTIGVKADFVSGFSEAKNRLLQTDQVCRFVIVDPMTEGFDEEELKISILFTEPDRRCQGLIELIGQNDKTPRLKKHIRPNGYLVETYSDREIAYVVRGLLFPAWQQTRKLRRYLASIRIAYQRERMSEKKKSQAKDVVAFNLCEGGMFLLSDTPEPIGTSLSLSFELEDGSELSACHGTVRYVRGVKEVDHLEVFPGMGIQFSDLPLKTSRSIKRFMQDNPHASLNKEFFTDSIDTWNISPDKYLDIGRYAMETKNCLTAMSAFNYALEEAHRQKADSLVVARCLIHLGLLYLSVDSRRKAKELFSRALKIYRAHGDSDSHGWQGRVQELIGQVGPVF